MVKTFLENTEEITLVVETILKDTVADGSAVVRTLPDDTTTMETLFDANAVCRNLSDIGKESVDPGDLKEGCTSILDLA